MLNKISELGQASQYDAYYNPARLFAIARYLKRQEIGVESSQLPFFGYDYWNHYEVSWLNAKGKPEVALAEIVYDCTTPYLIESKSLKLYFNSFNNTMFNNKEEIERTVIRDLSKCVQGDVTVNIRSLHEKKYTQISPYFAGECIDLLDITCSIYEIEPKFLTTDGGIITETLYSDLLKSNCLVTNQPDWGSVQIAFQGPRINREGLLKYIVSFRNHNEFHEQCIERIFMDIKNHCKPDKLTVYGRYTRRGGIDINPYRSTENIQETNTRLVRQ